MTGGETKAGNVFANRNYRLVFLGALVSESGALLYSFAVGFIFWKSAGTTPSCRGCTWPCAGLR